MIFILFAPGYNPAPLRRRRELISFPLHKVYRLYGTLIQTRNIVNPFFFLRIFIMEAL